MRRAAALAALARQRRGLQVDPGDSNVLYDGSRNNGLFRSTDAGATWTRINDDAHQFGGTGSGQVVVVDMNTDGMVYMSTVGRGIAYGAPT